VFFKNSISKTEKAYGNNRPTWIKRRLSKISSGENSRKEGEEDQIKNANTGDLWLSPVYPQGWKEAGGI